MLHARRIQRAAPFSALLSVLLVVSFVAPVGQAGGAKKVTTKASGNSAAKSATSAKATARAKHLTKAKKASVTLGALRRSQIERDRLRAKRSKAAAKVQASKVSSLKATQALEVLNSSVRLTGVALDKARRAANRASAEAASARAKERVLTKQLSGLRGQQHEAALAAFTGALGDDADTYLSSENVTEAGRRAELNSIARRTSADVIDRLSAVQQDLELQRAIADRAERKAAAFKSSVADRLSTYKDARSQQARVAADAEARLEAQLSEAESLKALDSRLSSQIAAQNDALARQLRSAGVGGRGSGSYSGGSLPSVGNVSVSGGGDLHGIVVASSIKGNLARLLAAAQRDGVYLSGGGYRSSSAQVRLRAAHCGSSSFAIYQMRSSQCHPPTARPGASMHERGLAIDFTQGRGALTRGSSGYAWLRANAGRFGFKNLPSEPWHWSVNGR
jgi:D-alanyl-D-alanine carboxypeptidase